MKRVICTWSGGKDCSLALLEARRMGYEVIALLNMMHDDGETSRSHGLPASVLALQARKMGLPILFVASTDAEYRVKFIETLNQLKQSHQIEGVVYGDIDLDPHRDWQEEVCAEVDLAAVFPIWNKNRAQISEQIILSGIQSIVVSCNDTMGSRFLGEKYTPAFVKEVVEKAIDCCGEEGEFHTLVIDGPHFKEPLYIENFATKVENRYHFIDWSNAVVE